MAERLPPVRHSRQQHDTAAWCAERAEADRITAAEAINDNLRRRHEVSAASWSARAEMLHRIEDSIRIRSGAPIVEVDEEVLSSSSSQCATATEADDVRI